MKLERTYQFEVRPLPPYSFYLTVNKPRYGYWLTPLEDYSEGVVWSAASLASSELVGLKVESLGNLHKPHLLVTVFLSDKSAKKVSYLKDRIREWLAAEDDVKDFYVLAGDYPALKQTTEDLSGFRDTHFPDVFNALILAFTLHRAPWRRSLQMLSSIYRNFGEKVEFDGHQIMLCPSVEQITHVDEVELREKCRLGYRARNLKSAASTLTAGFPRMEELKKMPPIEAEATLKQINGVGQYSADIITPHPSFPVDSWSAGIFGTLFDIEMVRKRTEMISNIKEFAKNRFGIWQGYVYAYILHDLQNLVGKFGLPTDLL